MGHAAHHSRAGTDNPREPQDAPATAADTQAHTDVENFDGIGVPPRTAWLASAVLYGTAAGTFTILGLATDLIPKSILAFSGIGLIMALLCLVGAKRFTDAWWGGHFRSFTGMLIITGGALAIGDVHSATAMVMLYPMLVTAYLYDARRSIPYVVVGTAWFVVTLLVLVPDPSAHAIATGFVIAGISAVVVRSQQELRHIVQINRDLSVTDALTGVANVRRLRSRLRELLSPVNGDANIALFGIDLDDFKLVNDQFSHTRGDEVLKAVADEIQAVLAEDDLLARRGGDEFAVIVPEARGRDLQELEIRIAKAIEVARMRVCPEVNPRGSVAHVTHVPGETVDEFLERCDAALHESKLDAHPERRFADPVMSIRAERRSRRDASTRADHRVSTSSDAISDELRMAREIQHALGYGSIWNAFAILSIACALAIVGSLATITGAELKSPLPLIAAIGLFGQGFASMMAARVEAARIWMHAQLVGMIAFVSLAVWSAGPLSASLADLFIAPTVCAVYALPAKRLPPYLLSGLGLFVAALATSDYEFTVPRVAVTGVIVLVLVGLLAKARRVTHEFTARAVEQSTVDPLTGVANLRGMRRGVADAIERCGRSGEILALIAIDLDEFKLVNDAYSHTMGDRVLVSVAEAMAGTVRPSDLLARRGGDEFALVAMITEEHELIPLMERIGNAISAARKRLTPDITSSASIGCVVWRRGEDADTFLARADEELHGAKLVSRDERARTGALRTA